MEIFNVAANLKVACQNLIKILKLYELEATSASILRWSPFWTHIPREPRREPIHVSSNGHLAALLASSVLKF